MECGMETGGGAGHDPRKGKHWIPRESTLTWSLGNLGSRLLFTLDLGPDSANVWVNLGQITPTP